jgi:serine/threonine-protein kinase
VTDDGGALSRFRAALAGRYSLERELGRGGMAIVWLARDRQHDRAVALKVLRPAIAQALGADRFLREIELTARLRHPGLVPLLEASGAAGLPYFTMPYVAGESLRDRLRRETQLPLAEALRITLEVAEALSYAHSQGVVHRDVKPENILLEHGHAMVTDFGLAKALTEAGGKKLTDTGITVGTPAYMSPEQGAGSKQLDPRSDLYSLATVLYEMLAGDPPFSGVNGQAILARKAADPVPRLRTVRPDLPPPLEQVIERALARAPADRFATVEEFAATLATAG